MEAQFCARLGTWFKYHREPHALRIAKNPSEKPNPAVLPLCFNPSDPQKARSGLRE